MVTRYLTLVPELTSFPPSSGSASAVVRHDGRLATLEAECDLRDVGWEPAVVVWCPVAKGQQLLVKVPPPAHLVKEGLPALIRTPLSCSLT